MTQTIDTRERQRGYAAGRRRKKADVSAEQRAVQQKAFRQRAFLAVLPFAMAAEDWNRDGEPIRSVGERVRLAADIAEEAARQMI